MRSQVYNLLKNGKYFCILPWVHLNVTSLGYMVPCCVQVEGPNSTGYGNLNINTFCELWQGKTIRNFRLKMLADEPDERCINCYEKEKAQIISQRMQSNAKYQKHLDWVVDTDNTGNAPSAKPIFWDIRFSNLCNLRCRTCGYSNSSSWYNDENVFRKLYSNRNSKVVKGIEDTNKFLKELEKYYSFVEKIYFAGGEPLLFKENLLILEQLNSIKKYDIELVYNTNFTLLNRINDFLKWWKKFKGIRMLISLDGTHERCEYLRKGLIWKDIVENLHYLKKECPHVTITINFTVSVFNILHVTDFHKEMVEQGYIRPNEINLNILSTPKFYNIRIMPEELKLLAKKKMKEHYFWLKNQEPLRNKETHVFDNYFKNQWYSSINYMDNEDWTHLIPRFIRYTNKLDKARNEKCLDVFPELKPIFCPEIEVKG